MHRVTLRETKRMSAVSGWLNAIFVLNISFQITERKETLFTTFLFSLLCSGYFNEIINEFSFSRFAIKLGNKELWWHRPIPFHCNKSRNLTPFIGPLHNPVTWNKITHAGEQVAQWDFQNNAPAFVLEVPLRNLLTSICNFAPCDQVVQRAYYIAWCKHLSGCRVFWQVA